MNDTDTPGIVAEIFARFARYGHLEYGEFVTQQQHALQTAHLAEGEGAAPGTSPRRRKCRTWRQIQRPHGHFCPRAPRKCGCT